MTDIDPGFTTTAMDGVFSASSRVSAMLRVEAALAAAQAGSGIIPAAAADAIVAACAKGMDDADAILREGWIEGTPVLPLLAQLRARLPDEAASWVHFGATTQDIVDTAAMLQMRDGSAHLVAGAFRIVATLRSLIEQFGTIAVSARTFLQPAEPTTFGYRAARWLGPIAEMGYELTLTPWALQLSGPIGDASSHEVALRMVEELGLLSFPTWQTDRRRLKQSIDAVSALAAWAAKIARDLVVLAQPEIGEAVMRSGGSSAMPHKRNPIDAMRAIAAAEANGGVASIVLRSSPHELERGVGGWHAEWFAIPLVFQTAGAALAATGDALAGLVVEAPLPAPIVTPERRRAAEVFVTETLDRAGRLSHMLGFG